MRKLVWGAFLLLAATIAPDAKADAYYLSFAPITGLQGLDKSMETELISFDIGTPPDTLTAEFDEDKASLALLKDFDTGTPLSAVFLEDFDSNSNLILTDEFDNAFVASFAANTPVSGEDEATIRYGSMTETLATPEPSALPVMLLLAFLAPAFKRYGGRCAVRSR